MNNVNVPDNYMLQMDQFLSNNNILDYTKLPNYNPEINNKIYQSYKNYPAYEQYTSIFFSPIIVGKRIKREVLKTITIHTKLYPKKEYNFNFPVYIEGRENSNNELQKVYRAMFNTLDSNSR